MSEPTAKDLIATTATKAPARQGDGAKKGLDDDGFQKLVTTRCETAVLDMATIATERAKATDYYKGKLPDVDSGSSNDDDRSKAVLSDVRDTVMGMMPDLMRTFFGSDSVCAYQPVASEDPEQQKRNENDAKLATDYVHNVVLKTDNPDFFQSILSTFQDGLVRKVGFVKAWWEKSKKPSYTTHTGLDQDMVAMLLDADDVEIVNKRTYVDKYTAEGSTTATPAVRYDLTLKRVCDRGRVRIKAVPCENIFVSQSATTIDDAPVFGYSEDKTASWFIEQGLVDTVAELEGFDRDPNDSESQEQQARNLDNQAAPTGRDSDDTAPIDKSQNLYKYTEAYVIADKDGDGIAELIRVQCAGTSYHVLKDEPWDECQYAAFAPYPEAHVFFGESAADLTMDTQRISSRILRDILDNLAQAVKPQTAVVEGQVNLDDVLNPDTSNVIRMRAPGMVTPFLTPFVGKEGLPILDLMKNVREGRTGMSDASQGLDPKVLQSTDKGAVQATLTKAQARIEMVARVFAEMGMRRLFRIILKLIIQNQDEARVISLRGSVSKIDPRSWNADMHVSVDVPFGRGAPGEQVQFLLMVLAKQEQIIAMLGPDNPICSISQYRYTLAKILELSGWANTESFFGDPSKLPPEQLQAIGQKMAAAQQGPQPQGPAAPDPQVEMAKIKSNEAIKQAEIQFKRDELATKTQVEMAKIEADTRMRALEIQATHHATLTTAQMDNAVKAAGDRLKSETAIIVEKLKPRGGSEKGTSNASQ